MPVPEQGSVSPGPPEDMGMAVGELGDSNVVYIRAKLGPLKGATSRISESGIKSRGNRPPRFQGRGVLRPVRVTIKVARKNIDAAVNPSLSTLIKECLRLGSYASLPARRGVYIPKSPQKILKSDGNTVHVVRHNLILLGWPTTRQVEGHKRGKAGRPATVVPH